MHYFRPRPQCIQAIQDDSNLLAMLLFQYVVQQRRLARS